MFSWLELKIPPPVVAIISAGLMWLLTTKLGLFSVDIPNKLVLCGFLAGLGLLVDFVALWRFMKAKTTVNPIKPNNASALVTSGIYQYTRNPMYVGNFIFLTAYLIWLGSPYNVICLALYVLYMNEFQIQPEERVLQNMFGDEYRSFCSKVRRWI
ncbi:MAG TPA: isoprenylcysteine carboxylmethyltransferase family protein [Cycloclasticus sp.]|jgi:protein-S-isoprenylcysteine O-methyltransferase Ste14|nr:isoprenylcysteine carboxylmethyltransferase family protein [Cycloclasticus sp.]HIL92003.1 isoprenylcysteine carboxylmethyltransferase family protein [Cycloclasticus sp.]